MELFKTLSSVVDEDTTITIAIRKSGKDKLVVSTAFSGKHSDDVAPFVLKGTAEEMDAEYVSQIGAPIEAVTGLINNSKAFAASVAAAQKKKEEDAKKKTSAPAAKVSPAMEKINKENERKKEVAKKVEVLTAVADKANEENRFFTSAAIYGKALSLCEDSKIKDALKKKLEEASRQKASFFCADSQEEADKELNDVLAELDSTAKSDTAVEPAAPVDDDNEASDESDNEEESSEETEEDNE